MQFYIKGDGGGSVSQSCPTLATPWTVARQVPLTMEFSWQEYWSGLPFPLPGDLPDPGIEPESLASPALAGGFFTTNTTWEAHIKGGGGGGQVDRVWGANMIAFGSVNSHPWMGLE